MRVAFGLRADLSWILQVSADSGANWTYGVAFTPDEQRRVDAQVSAADELVDLISIYAVNQADFAGLWVDHQRGGTVFVAFTSRLEEHRLTLSSIAGSEGPWTVVPAQWTWADLQAVSRRVNREESWLLSIGAALISAGVDVAANRVHVEISSANHGAPELVVDRYGGPDKVIVDSDDTGERLLGRGTLVLVVVDSSGRPAAGQVIKLESSVPGVCCERVGITDASPAYRLTIPATPYRVTLVDESSGAIKGAASVIVRADTETTVRVVLSNP